MSKPYLDAFDLKRKNLNLYKYVKGAPINIAAVGDIAADTAYTIGWRGQWKDYVDIFLKDSYSPAEIKRVLISETRKFNLYFSALGAENTEVAL